MSTRMITRLGVAASALALASAPVYAQATATVATVDPRWQAFVGCWEPVGPDGAADAKSMNVCVLPSSTASAVDVVTVQAGAVNNRSHVDAGGERHPIGRDGCTGVESALWSTDGQRVYLSADISCNGISRKTSGLLAFSPSGEWMDVQGVTAGNNTGVHVTRYRPMASLDGMPSTVTSALAGSGLAVSTARLAATGTVEPEAVIDAIKHVDVQVAEAWLLERGQGFKLDGKQLVALADAGVPGRVTDLMVALSNPKVFAVNQSSREAERVQDTRAAYGRTAPIYVDSYGYSPYGWSAYSPYYYGYGYNRYGYGAGYGYGYNNGWYYGNQPIVIVNRGDAANPGNLGSGAAPRVVNGRGYSSGASRPSSSSGSGSSSTGSSTSSGTSSGSSSSGSSSGSSTAGQSSGSGRTAHPRP